MSYQPGEGCVISKTAVIADGVRFGRYNRIGEHVVIAGFKGAENPPIEFGDCNTINDHTRIMVGADGLSVGDWNTFHNHVVTLGSLSIGHNNWFGQNVVLDGSAGLEIGNGVTIGMQSRVWSHVARGELIEGCTLFQMRKTVIEDDVWVVGSCSVASGVRLAYRSIILGTHAIGDTEPGALYANAPRDKLPKTYWRQVAPEEKRNMLLDWACAFCDERPDVRVTTDADGHIVLEDGHGHALVFGVGKMSSYSSNLGCTYFDLKSKRYTKRLTQLERDFYFFLKDYKARFLPVETPENIPTA